MRFISSGDLRQKSGEVWESVEEEDFVITVNGKPVAILMAAEEDLGMQLKAIRQARAELAVFNMQRLSEQKGLTDLSDEEIEAEIKAARRRPASGRCS